MRIIMILIAITIAACTVGPAAGHQEQELTATTTLNDLVGATNEDNVFCDGNGPGGGRCCTFALDAECCCYLNGQCECYQILPPAPNNPPQDPLVDEVSQ